MKDNIISFAFYGFLFVVFFFGFQFFHDSTGILSPSENYEKER